MIPLTAVIQEGEKIPSYTYKLDDTRVRGYVDGSEAVKQAVYKILMTERYKYIIYGFNYGVELDKVIGRGKSEAKAMLPEIIRSALCCDSRISEVNNFEFTDIDKESLLVKFTVISSEGEIEGEVRADV
ncbi:MAG: DUF2634 domain-containing protein [Clostridiales bacterium]|nr:DUF2634 domain-containing protein [Clostridiales bacterium]